MILGEIMPEPNQTNVSFNTSYGEPSLNRLIRESQGAARDSKKRVPKLSATLNRVVKWIEEQEYDDFTKQELIKVAKSYPVGALPYFKMAARNHLKRIQEKQRMLARQEVVKKSEIDMGTLKQEEQDKIREYRILRNQQKKEQESLILQEEELKKLATQEQQTTQQPQGSKKMTFPEPPSSSQKSPEEIRQSLENRRVFAQRMKELAEEDNSNVADEEWMN
jgi:hypothetical protein